MSIDDVSLPAVPARFNSITSGAKRKVESKPIVEEFFDPDMYKRNEAPKVTKVNSNNIFADTETQSVINFNDCKLNAPLSSCNLLNDLPTPVATKKRKFQTMMKNFEPMEPEPSTSGLNSNFKQQMQNSANEVKKLDNKEENEKKSPSDRKREMGKVYLKTVSFFVFD